MIFRIRCNTFFQQTSSFPKFSLKHVVRKLGGINFNHTYRLHLVLVIRIYFDKNLIYPEIQATRKIILISSQFTEYVQHQVLYQIKQQIYKFLLSMLSFLHDFKLKTEVIIKQIWSYRTTALSQKHFIISLAEFHFSGILWKRCGGRG